MFGRNQRNPVDGGVEKKKLPSAVRFEIDLVNVHYQFFNSDSMTA